MKILSVGDKARISPAPWKPVAPKTAGPLAAMAGAIIMLSGCASTNEASFACRSYENLRPFTVQTTRPHSRDRAWQLAELDARMHRRLKKRGSGDADIGFLSFASVVHAYTAAMADLAATHSRDTALRSIASQMVKARKEELESLCALASEAHLADRRDLAGGIPAPSMIHRVASGPRLGLHESTRINQTFVEAALTDLQAAVEQAEAYRIPASDQRLRDRATRLAEMYRADIDALSAWREQNLSIFRQSRNKVRAAIADARENH